MEIVVNRCYGGFGLSDEAIELYLDKKGLNWVTGKNTSILGNKEYEVDGKYFSQYGIPRNDPILIEVVEELGEKANSQFSKLEIIEVPDYVEWELEEYDGNEWIAEKHRTW
jgi:hypothetical protein